MILTLMSYCFILNSMLCASYLNTQLHGVPLLQWIGQNAANYFPLEKYDIDCKRKYRTYKLSKHSSFFTQKLLNLSMLFAVILLTR